MFSQLKNSPLLLLLRVNATHSWRRLLAVRDQSRLLTSIIGMFVVGYLVLSFWLFYYALKFIAKFPGLGAVLTERLLFVLFAFLFGLLLLVLVLANPSGRCFSPTTEATRAGAELLVAAETSR